MHKIKSMGFPRMHKEKSEKRDFLPGFFANQTDYDVDIVLEEGYGEKLGFSRKDYLEANGNIRFADHDSVYGCDLVIVLRCPEPKEIQLMRPGSILISMLHFETRTTRNQLFLDQGIHAFSMDAMTNDQNERILVNYKGTSSTGSRIAFRELKKRTKDFINLKKDLLKVSIIGAGAVAAYSAKAFEKLGDDEFLEKDRGLLIQMMPRCITQNEQLLLGILKDTDILVDASKRPDPSQLIISNKLLGHLPNHAIILDLTADPYNEDTDPIQVKGIEGIPTGTLDKYVIEPGDELYKSLPDAIDRRNQRVVVSCNAWPGVDAEDCMNLYGKQLQPFIDVLLSKKLDELDISSRNLYERSLVRASLDYYLEQKK